MGHCASREYLDTILRKYALHQASSLFIEVAGEYVRHGLYHLHLPASLSKIFRSVHTNEPCSQHDGRLRLLRGTV